MPRCRSQAWCVDDLCHMTSRTLCGLWVDEELDAEGEWAADDEWPDDEPTPTEHSCHLCHVLLSPGDEHTDSSGGDVCLDCCDGCPE